jgi:glycosyltransferase involved in cell wall biosynthesis
MRELVDGSRVRASVLQRLPNATRYFRLLAPFYPAVFEGFDLSAYDVVVSSTSAWAKGVRVGPRATHVCYIHTVSRFVFAYDEYVRGFAPPGFGAALATLARPLFATLGAWDREAARRPTAFVANSRNAAERIRRYYGRDAYVLHAPIDLERFAVGPGDGDFALVVSRLLGYKQIDRAIAACRLANLRLLVVGTGPALDALKAAAVGTRTEFLGAQSDDALRALLGRARVVLLPGEEDYGLVPLEANASGRPVIAFGRGGALETVLPGVTGELFGEPTPRSLADALLAFDPGRYDPAVLRAHAESFGAEPFRARFAALVEEIVRSGASGTRDVA